MVPVKFILIVSTLALFLSAFSLKAEEQQKGYIISLLYDSGRLEEIQTFPFYGYFDFGRYSPASASDGPVYSVGIISFEGIVLWEKEIQVPLFAEDLGFLNSTYVHLEIPYFDNAKRVSITNKTSVLLEVDLSRFSPDDVLQEFDQEKLEQSTAMIEIEKKADRNSSSFGEEIEISIIVTNPNRFPVEGLLSDSNGFLEPSEIEFPVSIPPKNSVTKTYKAAVIQGRAGELDLGRAYFFMKNRTFFSDVGKIRVTSREKIAGNMQYMYAAAALLAVSLIVILAAVVLSRKRVLV